MSFFLKNKQKYVHKEIGWDDGENKSKEIVNNCFSAISLIQTPKKLFSDDVKEVCLFKQDCFQVEFLFADLQVHGVRHNNSFCIKGEGVSAGATVHLYVKGKLSGDNKGTHIEGMWGNGREYLNFAPRV